MANGARLAIGMPVYNGEAFLEAALDSLLAQTFGDFEIVVCDNASTDRTPAIVEEFRSRDRRIRYMRNERNIGANGNFSKVVGLTTAPLFKWAAHDDLYEKTYLERCVALLDRDPAVVLAHSDTEFIDEAGTAFLATGDPRTWLEPTNGARFVLDPVDIAEGTSALNRFREVVFASLWGTDMFGIIRRETLERTGLIQDVPNSDRPLLAELALLGRFAHVRAPLYRKRFHSRMSLAMSGKELVAYVSAASPAYLVRGRQMRVYLSTPTGKPVSWLTRTACRGLVIAYAAHTVGRTLSGRRHDRICPSVETDSLARNLPRQAS